MIFGYEGTTSIRLNFFGDSLSIYETFQKLYEFFRFVSFTYLHYGPFTMSIISGEKVWFAGPLVVYVTPWNKTICISCPGSVNTGRLIFHGRPYLLYQIFTGIQAC